MSDSTNLNNLKHMPESYWREHLTPEQFHITRQKGTERAFSGELYYNKEQGVYGCVACGQPLFASANKFESGSGWPSFDRPITENSVEYHEDKSLFMRRVEITCSNCGAHLGHVFEDGPRETTGQRYCINSVSLGFQPQSQTQTKEDEQKTRS